MQLGSGHLSFQELRVLDSSLPCVPPSEGYVPMMGKVTILIKLDYLNLPFEKRFEYRYGLWGSPDKIYFAGLKSQLKITASLQSLSSYLWDMNVLCIEIVSVLDTSYSSPLNNAISNSNQLDSTMKKEKQKKIVGYAFVPLRKYFVNHVMNGFVSEKFVVVDQGKKKLGEMGVEVRIQMVEGGDRQKVRQLLIKQHNNQGQSISNNLNNKYNQPTPIPNNRHSQQPSSQHSPPLPTLTQRSPQHIKKVTISQRNPSLPQEPTNNRESLDQYRQVERDLVQKKYSKKNYFSHEELYLGMSMREIVDEVGQGQEGEGEKVKGDSRGEGSYREKDNREVRYRSIDKQQHVNYNCNNKQQSELSVIVSKYGYNHPPIQLMKLRLDQARYLQAHRSNELTEQPLSLAKLKLVLRSLSNISGLRLGPKLLILSLIDKKQSKLVSRTQINLQNLSKTSGNKLQLNYLVVLNSPAECDRLLVEVGQCSEEVTVKNLMKGRLLDLRRKDRKRVYELSYDLVQDSPNPSLPSHPSNILPTPKALSKTKLLNNILNTQPPNNEIPQNQHGQKAPSQPPNHPTPPQPPSMTHEEMMSQTVTFWQGLYQCDDQKCLQIINRLRKVKQWQGREAVDGVRRLQDVIKCQGQLNDQKCHLHWIVARMFKSSFQSFYSTYLSYKQLNSTYRLTLYKLSKILSFQPQDTDKTIPLMGMLAVIDYIRKYRKQLISFGLIKERDFISVLEEKGVIGQVQQKEAPKEKEQNPNPYQQQKFIDSFVNLFGRYQGQFIKLSEMQGYIKEIYSRLKGRKGITNQTNEVNVNLEVILRLYRQSMKEECERFVGSELWGWVNDNYSKVNDSQSRLYGSIQQMDTSSNNNNQNPTPTVSLYAILFQDTLSLSQLQSSLHYAITQPQYNNIPTPYPNRLATYQSNVQQASNNNNKLKTQYEENHREEQQQNNRRLRTEQLAGERQRLNTEDERVIEVVNGKGRGGGDGDGEGKGVKGEEVVEIQVIRKDRFVVIGDRHEGKEDKGLFSGIQQQNQYNQQNKQNNQVHQQLEQQSLPLRRPSSKHLYITLRLSKPTTTIKPFSTKSLQKQEQTPITIFLVTPQHNSIKLALQRQQIIANPFPVPSKSQPMSHLQLQLQNLPTLPATTLLVTNTIGHNTYPIQTSEGHLLYILNVELEEVTGSQSIKYEQQQGSTELKEKDGGDSRWNRVMLVNVKRLMCLDMVEVGAGVRVIYQRNNGLQLVKDIIVGARSATTRVIQLGMDIIKLNNVTSSDTHIIKLFRLQRNPIPQPQQPTTTNHTKRFPPQPSHPNRKTSLPVTRYLQPQSQNPHNTPCDLLCQFEFKLSPAPYSKDTPFGVIKDQRWLQDEEWRLELEVIDVRYERYDEEQSISMMNRREGNGNRSSELWDRKIEKILQVFSYCNRVHIRNIYNLQLNNNNNYQQLLQLITQRMKYRLTQTQILTQLIFPSHLSSQPLPQQTKHHHLLQLLSLTEPSQHNCQRENQYITSSTLTRLSLVYQEFETFDLEHKGMLTELKYQVVKRVLPELNRLQGLQGNGGEYSSGQNSQLEGKERWAIVKDLNPGMAKSSRKTVDYLKLLWDLRHNYQDDFFNPIVIKHNSNLTQNKNQTISQLNPTTTVINTNLNKPTPLADKNSNNNPTTNSPLPQFYSLRITQFSNLTINNLPLTLQFRINNNVLFNPVPRRTTHKFPSQSTKFTSVQLNVNNPLTFTLEIYNRTVVLQKKKEDAYEYRLIEEIDLRNVLREVMPEKGISQKTLQCQNLQGSITLQVQIIKTKQQFDKIVAANQQQLDLQHQEVQPYKLDDTKYRQLREQFYQAQLPQHSKPISKNEFIGDSFLNAISQPNKFKTRDQDLLKQTRQQWQQLRQSKGITKDNEDISKNSMLQSVLKTKIQKAELDRKFNNFSDDDDDSDLSD